MNALNAVNVSTELENRFTVIQIRTMLLVNYKCRILVIGRLKNNRMKAILVIDMPNEAKAEDYRMRYGAFTNKGEEKY